jgi:hypothetical protein
MEKRVEVSEEEEKHRIRGLLEKLHLKRSDKSKSFEQAFELIRRDVEIVYGGHKDVKRDVKPASLKDVLERIDADERKGELYEEADWFQEILEKRRKGFDKDEWLTERIKNMIAIVGKDILSKEEIKEAQDRFKGAMYFDPNPLNMDDMMGTPRAIYNLGWIRVSAFMKDEDSKTDVNRLEYHEAVHHIHSFLRVKQLESGDIRDPIVKKLHDYLHGKYDDEVICAMENRYTGMYDEAIANAVSFNAIRSLGVAPYKDKATTPPGIAGIIFFADFLRDNPEKFRELMLKPSEAVGAGSVKLVDYGESR